MSFTILIIHTGEVNSFFAYKEARLLHQKAGNAFVRVFLRQKDRMSSLGTAIRITAPFFCCF